jgi:hypothetical protein
MKIADLRFDQIKDIIDNYLKPKMWFESRIITDNSIVKSIDCSIFGKVYEITEEGFPNLTPERRQFEIKFFDNDIYIVYNSKYINYEDDKKEDKFEGKLTNVDVNDFTKIIDTMIQHCEKLDKKEERKYKRIEKKIEKEKNNLGIDWNAAIYKFGKKQDMYEMHERRYSDNDFEIRFGGDGELFITHQREDFSLKSLNVNEKINLLNKAMSYFETMIELTNGTISYERV